MKNTLKICMAIGMLMALGGLVQAATVQQIGNYAGWGSVNWTSLTGLNDPNDSIASTELDFVGNTADPGAYWARNATYLFFRFRVQYSGTVVAGSTFHDAHMVLIDIVGKKYNGTDVATSKNLINGTDTYPDYAFSWDSKSNINTSHGLEMQVRSTVNTYWNGINMTDIDYVNGSKGINDINGTSRTTDGYVETVDSVSTTSFGKTTFVDFAISWNYLNTYTALNSAQSWNIALGSIANATDHNNLDGDIGGGANPASLENLGWVNLASIPEPTSLILLLSGGALLLRRTRPRQA